jgi:hypothetical protein
VFDLERDDIAPTRTFRRSIKLDNIGRTPVGSENSVHSTSLGGETEHDRRMIEAIGPVTPSGLRGPFDLSLRQHYNIDRIGVSRQKRREVPIRGICTGAETPLRQRWRDRGMKEAHKFDAPYFRAA